MRKFIFMFAFLIILAASLFSKTIFPAQGLTPELEALMAQKSDYWGVDRALVKAIAKAESNFDLSAKNPQDPSYGLMQITPGLAYDYGGLVSNWHDPSSAEIGRIMEVNNNLNVACWYLAHLTGIRKFDIAVQMYNVGQTGYMDGARNYDYLEKVRKYYEIYRA